MMWNNLEVDNCRNVNPESRTCNVTVSTVYMDRIAAFLIDSISSTGVLQYCGERKLKTMCY